MSSNSGQDKQWAIATVAPNTMIGNLIISQLGDEGIEAVLVPVDTTVMNNDFAAQNVLVPLNQLEEARKLIDSAPTEMDQAEQ